MPRPKDASKWLTGYVGYAAYPRPDILRAENRLAQATNVWLGGTTGLAQRRGGMSYTNALTGDLTSLVTVPVFAGEQTYTSTIFMGADGFGTSPAADAHGGVVIWSGTGSDFTSAVTLNRKAFLAPASVAATYLRLVDTQILGYPAPAAPTAANTGSGTLAASARYYRVQWYGTDVLAPRGPLGPALTFTPSGSGSGVIVTRPSLPATGNIPTHWYLWVSWDNATYYRTGVGTAVATTTMTDTAPYNGIGAHGMYDPVRVTPDRYVGMEVPTVEPSLANTGSGTYPATLRYYRVRWVERTFGTVTRRGEPSGSISITPSGTGTAVRVTQPSYTSSLTAGYYATHWEIEASIDNTTFYVIATVVLATTTYDDSALTSTYSAGNISETVGDYTVPPLCRSIAADRDRLLFAGGWTDNFSRVWYTPVLGSAGVADEERVPTDNYFDIEAHDDDEIRAIIGPIGGSLLVFKRRSMFRLMRTGDVDAPYDVIKITEAVGCDGPSYVCLGPTENGEEAAYFTNLLGHWRYDTTNGLTRLNDDLSPVWQGQTTPTGRVVYYPARNAVLFGEYAYSVHLGGWTWQDWTKGNAALQCIARWYAVDQDVLIIPSIGATNDSIYRADDITTLTDIDTTAFTAVVRTNRFSLVSPTQRWRPVRLRAWGSGTGMTCKVYVASGATPIMTVNFTLGTAEETDLSELIHTGPIEWLGLSFTDGPVVAQWSIDALEITGQLQESIP